MILADKINFRLKKKKKTIILVKCILTTFENLAQNYSFSLAIILIASNRLFRIVEKKKRKKHTDRSYRHINCDEQGSKGWKTAKSL